MNPIPWQTYLMGVATWAVAVIVVLLLVGCGKPLLRADVAQTSDVATTALAIGSGAVEANPIVAPLVAAGPPGYITLLLIKLGLNRLMADNSPNALTAHEGIGWATSASNLALVY